MFPVIDGSSNVQDLEVIPSCWKEVLLIPDEELDDFVPWLLYLNDCVYVWLFLMILSGSPCLFIPGECGGTEDSDVNTSRVGYELPTNH